MSGIHIQNAKLKKRIKELEEENGQLKKQLARVCVGVLDDPASDYCYLTDSREKK